MEIYTPRRATVSIGTVREAEDGETPTVTVTEGQTLNFVLPQGITGPQGPQGPQGEKGETGDPTTGFTYLSATDMETICDEILT